MDKKVVAYLKGPFSLSGEIRLQFIDVTLAKHLVKQKIPLFLSGQSMTLTPISCRSVSKGIAFKFLEVKDRNDAEKIPKGDVEVQLDLLPKVTSDSYALEDLTGFKVLKENNVLIAIVRHVYNFGASDIIECELLIDMQDLKKEDNFSIPIIDSIVLDINFDAKKIIVSEVVDSYLKI